MNFLHIYDELDEVYDKLDSLKGNQYTMRDIPLNRRDELSVMITDIQALVLKVKNEVADNIKDEWL